MNTESPQHRSRMGCAAAMALAILIVALLGGYVFYRLESWPMRTARELREAFGEVAQVQPKITVNNRVVFEQTASVLELAVVSRPTQVEREMEHEWLGSKKHIKLRGTYQVRAGFDLTKPFSVKLEDNKMIVEIPPPRILSVDQVDAEVLALDNGYWNKIQPQDLETELRALPLLARQKATETGLQREALEALTKRLKERFSPQYDVEVRVANQPPVQRTD
ncbi:DUF4230 domain-containing protein [Verrucomicrobiota bacterium sgz303538]